MKVLLLQEMSGVHTELKKGLIKQGVHVELATLGQHFRKYKTDLFLGTEKKDKISSIQRAIIQLYNIPKLKSFDVIQTISPQPFHKGVSKLIENLVFDQGKKLIYIAAGSDEIYRKHVQELDYWPEHSEYGSEAGYEKLKKKLSNFSEIIPVCWEYRYAMQKAGFDPQDIIPFPIDVKSQKYSPFKKDKRIKVFHPLNRTNWKGNDFKGTEFILKAFQKLEKKYKGKVEFIVKGGMTSIEYDKFTDDVDIIVDQTSSYSYGMSAAYGLAKGKVVLSGLEAITQTGHYSEAPVINLKPDPKFIVHEIEKLLEDRDKITAISEKSREFAENYHDSEKVAKEYLKYYK
jgi:glycosyltransferase involved in cell wall biosynthesis